MRFRRFLIRGLNNVKAEATMMDAAFNMRVLYQVWRRRLEKARQIEVAGAVILYRFWNFNLLTVICMSESMVSTVD